MADIKWDILPLGTSSVNTSLTFPCREPRRSFFPNPLSPATTGDACTQEGPALVTGPFTSAMTGLTPNTTYSVRAYAAHAMGTFYGEQVSFSTMKGFGLLLYLPAILHGGQ